jgi:hypothetical protein
MNVLSKPVEAGPRLGSYVAQGLTGGALIVLSAMLALATVATVA